jgi:DNA replication protein DnaC
MESIKDLTEQVLTANGMNLPIIETTFQKITNLPIKYLESTFENYNIYDNRQKEIVEQLKNFNQDKSLVLAGKTGTGKTHLAISLCKSFPKKKVKFAASRDQHGNVLRYAYNEVNVYSTYIKADYFFDGCNKSIKEFGNKEEYISSLFKTDFLILDDLSINNFTPSKAENLYLLIDFADQQMKKFIITTNFTPQDFDKIDDRISSRLSELAEYKYFTWSDYRKDLTNKK